GPERGDLLLLALAVLNDVDLAGPDDECADAGVALANDLLPRFVPLLDRGIRDGLERALIEILEHGDALQEVDARRHGRDASRYSISMPEFRIEVAHEIAGCAATVALQEEVWSGDVVVHPQLMLAVVHNGGFVALGYAPEDPKPAGFVFGFLGIHDYHFRHHSHMLALRDPYRGSGLAQQLKARDPKLALEWRLAGRGAFERAFGEGYAAVEFLRAADGRGAYLLVPQPRRDLPLDTDDA